MRGICKSCGRNTIFKKDKLCQKCWYKDNKPKKTKLEIRETCIFCGTKWSEDPMGAFPYKPNWKCHKCGKLQFEHEHYKEFRAKDYLVEV